MSFTHAVVLDFEATCDHPTNPPVQEIIELPSVLLRLSDRAVVDEFESFVRPVHGTISAFCTELTSITQADVDPAPTFPEVLSAHERWMAGHGLTAETAFLVTCGDWDLLRMLPSQLRTSGIGRVNRLYRRWMNLKVPFKQQVPGVSAGMAGMLRALDLPLIGRHHRGIDDCRNIARILAVLLERGADPSPTTSLQARQFPPIPLVLVHADGREAPVVLASRSHDALIGLARKAFQEKVTDLIGPAGPLRDTADLLDLPPGARVHVA